MSSSNNRFDTMASEYDKQTARLDRAAAIGQAIIDNVPLDRSMMALDYGAGTGLILSHIQPHVKHIAAMDSSEGMIQVLQDKKKANSDWDNVTTCQHDIDKDDLGESLYHVICSGMTLHHVSDPLAFVHKASAALVQGGYLCIADLEAENGSFHDNPNGVKHHGFDPTWLQKVFERQNLHVVQNKRIYTQEKERKGEKRSYPIFMIVGKKQQE